MQLLKITSIPIKYEIHTEPARLEVKQAQNPSHVMTRNPSGWTMRAQNIQVRMDTTDLRASLNMRNSMDFARYYGDRGASRRTRQSERRSSSATRCSRSRMVFPSGRSSGSVCCSSRKPIPPSCRLPVPISPGSLRYWISSTTLDLWNSIGRSCRIR